MNSSADWRFPFAADLTICRLLNGLWQVSGAHGRIDPTAALSSMFDYMDAGFTTWDLADHYGPAEDFIGEFRRQWATARGLASLTDLQAFTKWVPRPGPMSRQVVEDNIDRSLRRMDVDALDLLQFHWWDYQDDRYLEALQQLAALQQAGKIRHLALTNFDTEHLRIILDQGIKIVSNQVQYSLVDLRPARQMAQLCQERGVHLLAYGTFCGGLLSDRYLGAAEPTGPALATASLSKYKQMIDAWGGWGLFQELLAGLKLVADRQGVSIANIAACYILEQPAVAGVIVGARLGLSQHREDNAQVFAVAPSDADRAALAEITGRGRDLLGLIGDCGDEYRRRG